ncbi:DUF4132 domain-containing protein [Micromonospora sp. NPDC002717]|uniref:DUF4132 domain-containing protein n=1 Tax=Micromonospora sp. NPDC002717 TaxID=3154424 RepID=UPI00331D990B
MAKQHLLTCIGAGSAKFWQVSQDGAELSIRFGRLGSTGQAQVKEFDTAEAATAAMRKLVAEKLRKGYTEGTVTAVPAPAVGQPTATAAARPAPVPDQETRAQAMPSAELPDATTHDTQEPAHLQPAPAGPGRADNSSNAVAPAEALPEVLVDPPWSRPRRTRDPVVVDGLVCSDEPSVTWRPGERAAWQATPSKYVSWANDPQTNWTSVAEHVAGVRSDGYVFEHHEISLFTAGPQEAAEPVIEHWRTDHVWDAADWMPAVLARFQLAALPMALDAARHGPAQVVPWLLPFASPKLAAQMAEWLARLKSLRPTVLAWLSRHPEAAARALIPPALGRPGPARERAEQALRVLASGSHEAVLTAAAGYGPDAAAAIAELVSSDPLDALPATMPVLPGWAAPDELAPIRLRDEPRVLPDEAVRHVLTMLAISQPGDVYAGVELVKVACDGPSLAGFAWSLFECWRAAGYPAEERWVLHSLGLLGDDTTVRALTPLIRVWPGENGHARAVHGLDVLAAIGSDVALMHLHGIAEKVKFSGLKQRAKQKLDEVAEQRGLTSQQLADRLVPDFGLADDGSLSLDYGNRRFVVGFDEQLRPYVAGADGRRRKDLPKPGAADDPHLAPAAYQRFTALKKDVRVVAADSIRRLEQAMVSRRRWKAEDFNRLLVGHPLLWHIVRRLVWGRYDDTGALIGGLRVAEDRSLADIDDDMVHLPGEAVVRVVHPVELGDSLPAWAQLFADYELVQPFRQLAREVSSLGADERVSSTLDRFAGLKVPTGRLLGLERRGWRRDLPENQGYQNAIEHRLPGGRTVVIDLNPGIPIGAITHEPDQVLERVWLRGNRDDDGLHGSAATFGVLHPVTASEILSDLDGLVS